MPWHAVETVAHRELTGAAGFNDQVFLAMRHGLRVRQIKKRDARVRLLRGNGLVAEIQAEPVAAGLADNPGQDEAA